MSDTKSSVVDVSDNHLYLYSEISDESHLKLVKELRALDQKLQIARIELPGYKPVIYLHISCWGGTATNAMVLAEQIRQTVIPVHTVIDGLASSGGSVISVAGRKRYMSKTGLFLIHPVQGGSAWGSIQNMEDNMTCMALLQKQGVAHYTRYSKLSKKQVKRLMKRDTYIDAKTALKYGFIDKIGVIL